METLAHLLEHYGHGLIFLFLCLEMLALPLPGEMMMSYVGLFVYEHKLGWFTSILSAGTGVLAGVTLSYLIGTAWDVRLSRNMESGCILLKNG